MNIRKVFGDNLRSFRIEQNLSQEKFAELCGLHRTYISDLECYQRNISIDNILKIAEALHVEPYLLIKEDD